MGASRGGQDISGKVVWLEGWYTSFRGNSLTETGILLPPYGVLLGFWARFVYVDMHGANTNRFGNKRLRLVTPLPGWPFNTFFDTLFVSLGRGGGRGGRLVSSNVDLFFFFFLIQRGVIMTGKIWWKNCQTTRIWVLRDWKFSKICTDYCEMPSPEGDDTSVDNWWIVAYGRGKSM